MIPIALTIKGLFSYQHEQTIQFDRLLEGQLFGIFGPVGSGKSSVLEAIAFALYGEMERLNLRDDRNYNMMNLKSDELLIDFIFRNFDDLVYRFTVKGKRNGKRFEKVNTFERRAYQYEQESWKPLAYTTAEELLGLSYENFRRTIIIPQGKFQEFLQLTDTARTEMLKEIFQLEKFEFFQQAASLERKNNESIHVLKGRLLTLEEVKEEDAKYSRTQLLLFEQSLEDLRELFRKKETVLKEQDLLQHLFGELEKTRLGYTQLLEQVDDYERTKNRLADFEYAERSFKADLQRLDELELGIEKRKGSMEEYSSQLSACNTSLMKLQQEQANAARRMQQLDGLKIKKQDYILGQTLLQLKAERDKLMERIDKGQVFVEKAEEQKRHSEKLGLQLREELIQKKAVRPDISELTEINAWFKQREYLLHQFQAKQQEKEVLVEDMDKQQLTIDQLWKDAAIEPSRNNPKETLAFLLEEGARALLDLEEQINQLLLQLKLSDYAAALHRGEPCPLCGSLEHPHIIVFDDVKEQLEQQQTDRQALLKRQQGYQELDRHLALSEAKLADLHVRKVALEKQEREHQQKIDEHRQSFKWQNYQPGDEEKVSQQLREFKELEKEIAELEKKISIQEDDSKKATQQREQYQEGLRKLVEEQRSKEGAFQSLIGQLQIISLDELLMPGQAELAIYIERIDQEIAYTTHTHEKIQQELQQQQHLKLTLETRLHGVEDNIKAEGERLRFIKNKLEEELQRSRFNQLDEIRTLLGNKLNVERLKKEVEQFNQQLYSTKEALNKLELQTQGKIFDQEKWSQLKQELSDLKEKIEEEVALYSKEKHQYERLMKQLEEKEKWRKELDKLMVRAQQIGVLKNMFKGNGFVGFVSAVYLRQLCEAANKRFYKLTGQQLKLEITGQNEFLVRDYLNDGKVRLAKTLSGGQTFQASLSLALALAESVQQQNKAKQNFFFLDEGFGSLDKESLNIAFDTLKSLRKENRIVGIISHVEELQQEIDVFLRVRNDALQGTKISGSWDN